MKLCGLKQCAHGGCPVPDPPHVAKTNHKALQKSALRSFLIGAAIGFAEWATTQCLRCGHINLGCTCPNSKPELKPYSPDDCPAYRPFRSPR